VRYRFIQECKEQECKEEFSTNALCRVMEVTPSGFYAWRNAPPSKRQEQNTLLLAQIEDIHQASRQSYGSPRIHQELREQGVCCGRHRVAHLMRVHQIRARQKRRYQVTTQSQHELAVSENLLERQFTAQAPDQRWAGDITYLWTTEGWLYLAVVLDLFSRRIIGWSMQSTLETRLVQDALSMALQARHPDPGLLHHSDRGSQYS
jgi:transposase InsO family protein